VFWNLRGNTTGCPAGRDTDNVQLLSGFSPSLLELVLTGNVPDEAGADSSSNVNPYMTFRRAMDNDKYDIVREVLAQSSEGLLQHYKFASPDSSASTLEADEMASSVAMEATAEPTGTDKTD